MDLLIYLMYLKRSVLQLMLRIIKSKWLASRTHSKNGQWDFCDLKLVKSFLKYCRTAAELDNTVILKSVCKTKFNLFSVHQNNP